MQCSHPSNVSSSAYLLKEYLPAFLKPSIAYFIATCCLIFKNRALLRFQLKYEWNGLDEDPSIYV